MRSLFGDSARRIVGAIFLTIAVGMLVAGELFVEYSGPGEFLIFWGTCFVFTGLSLFVALWDARAVMRSANASRKQLFRKAVIEVERKTGQQLGLRYWNAL